MICKQVTLPNGQHIIIKFSCAKCLSRKRAELCTEFLDLLQNATPNDPRGAFYLIKDEDASPEMEAVQLQVIPGSPILPDLGLSPRCPTSNEPSYQCQEPCCAGRQILYVDTYIPLRVCHMRLGRVMTRCDPIPFTGSLRQMTAYRVWHFECFRGQYPAGDNAQVAGNYVKRDRIKYDNGYLTAKLMEVQEGELANGPANAPVQGFVGGGATTPLNASTSGSAAKSSFPKTAKHFPKKSARVLNWVKDQYQTTRDSNPPADGSFSGAVSPPVYVPVNSRAAPPMSSPPRTIKPSPFIPPGTLSPGEALRTQQQQQQQQQQPRPQLPPQPLNRVPEPTEIVRMLYSGVKEEEFHICEETVRWVDATVAQRREYLKWVYG